MQDEQLTVEEIAHLVQVEPDTVQAWIARGLAHTYHVFGRANGHDDGIHDLQGITKGWPCAARRANAGRRSSVPA